MKIAVVHHSLNIPGGAERLCLAVIEALIKDGHEVNLVTVEKTDWNQVKRNFGESVIPRSEKYLVTSILSKNLRNLPFSITYFASYVLQLMRAKSLKKYDLVFNAFGDVINSLADITYVHFPLRAALRFSQVPAFTNNSIWRVVSPFYDSLVSTLDKINPGTLLTNSNFMKKVIENVLHRKSVVVYPPVDVETFLTQNQKKREKTNIVATIASFTPKRQLEQIPKIAENTKHAKFVVMGKADNYSVTTLEKLKTLIDELQVEDRVKLLTNVPFKRFLDVLSKTKVYLHVMPYDHFGISVVEAMASGCVPIVHRSGGPWLDILDGQQGKYGFSYKSPVEAAVKINMLINEEKRRREISSRCVLRAHEFSKMNFMNRIIEVVNKVSG
jgi:glycosyltransferase involved in cell wall biosynthesis